MKMKKTRKRIALLVMLCMLTMLLPAGTAHASEQDPNDMDYIFSASNNATLIKYKGKESHVEIPSTVTHNGISYSVKKIKDGAFAGCTDIESITIPKSVESILGEVFTGCSNLKTFYVAKENTKYCSDNGVLFNKDKKTLVAYPANKASTSYTIPESVTYIFDDAFQSCPNLEEIIFDPTSTSDYSVTDGVLFKTVTTNEAPEKRLIKYPEAKKDSSYTIPADVDRVNKDAFFNCTNLTSITIPGGMPDTIEPDAFSGSTRLTKFEVADGNKTYSATDGVLFNADKTVLVLYPKGKSGSYEIPGTVQSIRTKAFQNCSGLTHVTIPASVISNGTGLSYVPGLGSYAFSGCTGLTKVTFADNSNLDGIAEGAFANCTALTEINLPESITSIGRQAFENCSSLTSITIPQRVETIYEYAFSGCTGLTSITIPKSVSKIGGDAFSGCSNLRLVTFAENSNLQSVAYKAFTNCSDALCSIYNGSSTIDWSLAGIKSSQVKSKVNTTALSSLQLQSRTSKTITLKAEPDAQGTAAEYRMQGGIWQESPTFTGLTPNTRYTFEARYQATTLATPSEIATASFTTLAETASSGWWPSTSSPTLDITGQEGGSAVYDANKHTLTMTPHADWLVDAVSVDGTPVVVTDGVMVLEHIYSWSKVSVNFAKKPESPVKDNSKLVNGVKQTKLYASSKGLKQNKVRLTWRKANGYKVDYYLVYRATKKNGKYQLVYTTKRADQKSYTGLRTTKSGKRYYYKIRGVRVIDDKKYYTKDSNIISRK